MIHVLRRLGQTGPTRDASPDPGLPAASEGKQHRARVGTIIVNHELLDSVRPSRNDEVGLPDLPMETAPDPLTKDLTGYLYMCALVERARSR